MCEDNSPSLLSLSLSILTMTRLIICVVHALSRYMQNPNQFDPTTIRLVLWYLNSAFGKALYYQSSYHLDTVHYSIHILMIGALLVVIVPLFKVT